MPQDYDYTEKVIPDAFHGTCLKYSNNILSGKYQFSFGDNLRLGDGIYFYESSLEDAEAWASNKANCNEVAVLQSIIAVQEDKILDLHNYDDKKLLSEFAEEIENKFKEEGKDTDIISDGFIINYICKVFDDVFMVRATFTDITHIQKLHKRSNYSEYSQLVICVRNHDIIKNTKQVLPWKFQIEEKKKL